MPAGLVSPGHWALTIGYSGKENVLSRYEAELRRMAAESAAGNVTVLGDRVRAAAFAFKREFIPIALASSPATTIVKISVLPARLKDALVAAIKAANTNTTTLGSHSPKSGCDLLRFAPCRSQRSVPSSSSCYNESHFGCRRSP